MRLSPGPALAVASALLLAACARPQVQPDRVNDLILNEVSKAATHRPPPAAEPAQVRQALLPPLRADLPSTAPKAPPQRFDVSVANSPIAQILTAIVANTPYSLLLHPDVKGNVTLTLKDTTLPELLEALRDIYGYEYRIDGNRIFVQAAAIQTRVFRVNYMTAQRLGRSEIRVTSGSQGENPAGTPGAIGAGVAGAVPVGAGGTATPPGAVSGNLESSRIQTTVRSDFWDDLRTTLEQIIGRQAGRSVVVNPQAGIIVVRAMPDEQRQVAEYLREIRLSVERQVMLEAKIVEVTLSHQHQTGVNWALFNSRGYGGVGQLNPGVSMSASTTSGVTLTTPSLNVNAQPGSASVSVPAEAGSLIQGLPGGALLGLAIQARNFGAVIDFLETQGSVQVLSSPRIATLNNQKALLKVGTDEFFITGVSGGNSAPVGGTTAGVSQQFPTLTLRPFFSGVALDITPQIDGDSVLILHIRPSVSNTQQDDKNVNLGTAFGGRVTLPLPRSTVSETDSVVRVRDGHIVAIGGLMKLDTADSRSGLPGLKDIPTASELFGNDRRVTVKKELVILVKPTVIQSEEDWADDVRETRERFLRMGGSGTPGGRR